jgi:hypothetical protein
MTKRLSVSPAPRPLEDYSARFDDLFRARALARVRHAPDQTAEESPVSLPTPRQDVPELFKQPSMPL